MTTREAILEILLEGEALSVAELRTRILKLKPNTADFDAEIHYLMFHKLISKNERLGRWDYHYQGNFTL